MVIYDTEIFYIVAAQINLLYLLSQKCTFIDPYFIHKFLTY